MSPKEHIGKIVYKGNFFDYFIKAIFLLILVVFTAGIMLPYFLYWSNKYFFSHLEIEIKEKTKE